MCWNLSSPTAGNTNPVAGLINQLPSSSLAEVVPYNDPYGFPGSNTGRIPPPNKLRKIIFKDYCGLDVRQKLSIVGQMIGRKKLSESEIYEAMLMLHDNCEKITMARLALYIDCSIRTVHRNMSNELKKEKSLLNQQL